MKLEIQIDTRDFEHQLAQLSDKQVQASINRSLNRSAASTRSFASKLIRSELNVKDSALRARTKRRQSLLSISKAGVGGNPNLQASLDISARGPALTEFKGTRQTRKGLSVQIYKGRARKVLKGRFIYPGRRGGVSAERMRTETGRVPRGPIKLLFGPGLAQFAAKPRIVNQLGDHWIERFQIEVERDLAYRISKGGSLGGRGGGRDPG